MESNVKKLVTTSEQANGTIVITYEKSSAISAELKVINRFGGVLCTVISLLLLLAFLFSNRETIPEYFDGLGLFLRNVELIWWSGIILFIGLFFFWVVRPSQLKGSFITVIPGEGLISGKIQLAFNDIETINTVMNVNNIGNVYCVVGGAHVTITPLVERSVAGSISRLIQVHSGRDWEK
jgi:hypothetical protein